MDSQNESPEKNLFRKNNPNDESKLALVNEEDEIDFDYVRYKFRQQIDDTQEIKLVPIKDSVSPTVKKAKQFVKFFLVFVLFIFL